MGAILGVIKIIEKYARENNVKSIDTVVLQIGELSSYIPHCIEAVFPSAVEGTLLQDAKLEIEILPGNGRCKDCGKEFNLMANDLVCPDCGANNWEILCGTEFYIKEIACC